MTHKLTNFIRHARQKGMDHATIRVLLLSAGWPEKEIARSLAEEGLDFPVPEPPASGGAREAFQHLMALTSLGMVVVVAILIAFDYLDRWLPDPADSGEWYLSEFRQSVTRWQMAMLIVAFPLYAGFMYWINGDLRRSADRARSPVRRWLTFLALFAAALTMMIDGAALVYGLLQGELTTRFMAKTLLVLFIAFIVFSYYLLWLRVPEKADASFLRGLNWSFGVLGAVLVGLTLMTGARMIESPLTARLRKFDERRSADLQAIEWAIERLVVERPSTSSDTPLQEREKAKLKRPLPQDLEELARFVEQEEGRPSLSIHDPQSGQKYGYAIKGDASYELCADFAVAERNAYYHDKWNHPTGRHCVTIDVLKDR